MTLHVSTFSFKFLCVPESISERYYKIIVNDKSKFLRRLNDADMTF